MKKIVYLFLLFLLGLGHRVYSDTFIENYGSSTLTNVTVSPVSHTFKVDTPPFARVEHTEWYLTYSGGSPVETDSSYISDPSYTRSFSVGTYWVRAEVHDSNWNWQEVHRWEVTVTTGSLSRPDF